MAKSKKIVITSKTLEKAVLKRYRRAETQPHCRECGANTETLTLNEAASLLSAPWTDVINCVASGEYHTIGTDERFLAICARSIMNWKKRNEK